MVIMKIKLIYHLAELLHESAKSVVSKTQGGLHIYDAIAVYMHVCVVDGGRNPLVSVTR